MTKGKRHIWCMLLLAVLLFAGCTEQVDMSARYTYRDRTILDYLRQHAETYSSYTALLEQTHVSHLSETTLAQLLSARGHYTVFAPTNEAIQQYLDSLAARGELSEPSWEGFPDSISRDSVRTLIVMNSILDSGDDLQAYQTWDFPPIQDGEILIPNMYDRRLTVHYINGFGETGITVNDCEIDEKNRDIPAINGVIHCVHQVVLASENTLGRWLENNVKERRKGFYVSSLLAMKCGLVDTLNAVRDEKYEELMQTGQIVGVYKYPKHRKYGFTFFAETDSLWSALLGKDALDITVRDVVGYLAGLQAYPDAKNDERYEDEENLLNRFVTYHLLDRRLAKGHVVNHYNELGYDIHSGSLGVAKMQYYPTMGKRRLMKLFESKESHGVYINRCPVLDNGRKGTYHELSCEPAKEGVRVEDPIQDGDNNLKNAMVYPLHRLLVYDQFTRNCLGRERMRFDVATIPQELTNLDIRMTELTDNEHMITYYPPDEVYPFFDNLQLCKGTTYFQYNTARFTGWMDFEGDEVKFEGFGDVIMKLPPVPTEDTYEIRYRTSVQDFFGMQQIFFGTDPERLHATGIPIDLRRKNDTIGWEPDTGDEDYDAEVDKRIRNNDVMKGVNSHAGMPGSDDVERRSINSVRRILLREKMSPDKTYYLRQKLCLDYTTTLFLDYLEICPKSVYDNPEVPEDIW